MKLFEVGIRNEAIVEGEIQDQLPAAVHLDSDRDPVQVVPASGVVASRVTNLGLSRGVKEPRPRHRVPRELSAGGVGGGARHDVLRRQDQELPEKEEQHHHRRRGYHRGHLARDCDMISAPLGQTKVLYRRPHHCALPF